MKKKIAYTRAPSEVEDALDSAVRIQDFLPSPRELITREKNATKVTIALSTRSLDLFRRYARKHNAKYQTMIRRLVDSYAERALAE